MLVVIVFLCSVNVSSASALAHCPFSDEHSAIVRRDASVLVSCGRTMFPLRFLASVPDVIRTLLSRVLILDTCFVLKRALDILECMHVGGFFSLAFVNTSYPYFL